MPNWHTNCICCHKDMLDKFINSDKQVDFEMLRPMPQALNLVEGSSSNLAIAAAQMTEDKFKAKYPHVHFPYKMSVFADSYTSEDIESFEALQRIGQIYINNQKTLGARSWYNWCCDNWGCKWNACDTQIYYTPGDMAIVVFQTPWSHPEPSMFQELFDNSNHPTYYGEDFDEDFWGIHCWLDDTGRYGDLGEDSLIFNEYEEVYDEGLDTEEKYTYGEFNPKLDNLAESAALAHGLIKASTAQAVCKDPKRHQNVFMFLDEDKLR